jgi:uncharacterized membrane protein
VVLDRIEDLAWRIPLSTRRLVLIVASVVAATLLTSSLAAGWVAARNSDTIADARTSGLDVARAAVELRNNLAAADAQAASTLLSGGLEPQATRDGFVRNLTAANNALTDAGLTARASDSDDIEILAAGLTEYGGLVEMARANSRQGFPVGDAYLGEARTVARDDLMPTADHLRRVGEQRVARAANSVGGPVSSAAVAGLVVGLVVLLAGSAIVAGRSRRLTHPALLVATVVLVVALGAVTASILAQCSELRSAATTEIDAYVEANEAAVALSNLRVTEISAVAAHGSGDAFYDDFATAAVDLQNQLDGGATRDAVRTYIGVVSSEVRPADLDRGDNQAAAANTLEGNSADTFRTADMAIGEVVDDAFVDLGDRFDSAADVAVPAWLPIVLGMVAAVLAAGGILARGRLYR